MKQTPNINLPILEQGDKYLKETQNEAFSVIDREIAGLNSAISSLDNAEGSIIDTKNDVETLKNETNMLKASLNDMASNVIPNIQTSLDNIENKISYITYEEFGAVGNGLVDDGEAIKKAHTYANSVNLPIKCECNKSYYIKEVDNIIIKTSTDWNNSTLIIDDNTNLNSLFKVVDYVEPIIINNLSSDKCDEYTTKISSLSGYGNKYVQLVNSDKKIYKRYGIDEVGKDLLDMTVINNDGELLYPLNWSFDKITKAILYNIPESYLTLKNGNFITRGNDYSDNVYTSRGICIERSKVIVDNIHHDVIESVEGGSPSRGFIYFLNCYDVCLKNSTLKPRLLRVGGEGTYDLGVFGSLNIVLDSVDAFTLDNRYWGVWGGNFCKNIVVKNSSLNRIDSHCGSFNITISNTTIGNRGMTLIGGGTLNIENVTTYAQSLITLRGDYGANWNGDININNVKHYLPATGGCYIIKGDCNLEFDYGIECGCGKNIYINNYDIIYGNNTITDMWVINNKITGTENPIHKYKIFDKLDIRNVKSDTGKGISYICNFNLKVCECRKDSSFTDLTNNGNLFDRNLKVTTNSIINIDNVEFNKNAFSSSVTNFIYYNGYGFNAKDDYTSNEKNFVPNINIKNTSFQLNIGGLPAIVNIDNCKILHCTSKNGGTRALMNITNSTFEPYRNDTDTTNASFRINGYSVINNCIFSSGNMINNKELVNIVYEFIKFTNADYPRLKISIFNSQLSIDFKNLINEHYPNILTNFEDYPNGTFEEYKIVKGGASYIRTNITNICPNYYRYYDTNLNKECICVNKTWVDSSGATV